MLIFARSWLSRLLVAAAAVAALLSHVEGVSAQEAAEDPVYQSTIAEAVTEFGGGRWAEARALFKRAHALSPNARTLRGMGMCAYELRMYVPALRELQAALQEKRRALDDAQRVQVQQLIAQASNFIGRYQLKLTPPDAQVLVDDKAVTPDPGGLIFLELGDHKLRIEKTGYQPAVRRLRVEGLENQVLAITLEEKPDPNAVAAAPKPLPAEPAPAEAAAPAPPPPAPVEEDSGALGVIGWVFVGAAVLSAGGWAYAWYAGETQFEKFEEGCANDVENQMINHCTAATYDDTLDIPLNDTIATFAMVATIGFGVAGATMLTVDMLGDDGGESAPTARLGITPGGVQLTGSF